MSSDVEKQLKNIIETVKFVLRDTAESLMSGSEREVGIVAFLSTPNPAMSTVNSADATPRCPVCGMPIAIEQPCSVHLQL